MNKPLSYCNLTPVWICDISDQPLTIKGWKNNSKTPVFPPKVQPVVYIDGIRDDWTEIADIREKACSHSFSHMFSVKNKSKN